PPRLGPPLVHRAQGAQLHHVYPLVPLRPATVHAVLGLLVLDGGPGPLEEDDGVGPREGDALGPGPERREHDVPVPGLEALAARSMSWRLSAKTTKGRPPISSASSTSASTLLDGRAMDTFPSSSTSAQDDASWDSRAWTVRGLRATASPPSSSATMCSSICR